MDARLLGDRYTKCAASGTQALGTGAIGDVLRSLLVVPSAAAVGAIQIKDGSGGGAVTIDVFAGATVPADLKPFSIDLGTAGIKSRVGGWSVIVGANASVVACGNTTP